MNTSTSRQSQQKFLVIDDHETILAGSVPALEKAYPGVAVFTASDANAANKLLKLHNPTLVVLDLSLPKKLGEPANLEVGMQLLQLLMARSDFAPNIMVLSTNIKPLVQLKPIINAYEGGFAAVDKSLPIGEMLRLVDLALRGSIHLPTELRSRPEFDRKWLEMLTLKYREGLTDKAIAERMQVSDRTIRNYWLRLQEALGVHEQPDKELRIQIEIAAREIGLIS